MEDRPRVDRDGLSAFAALAGGGTKLPADGVEVRLSGRPIDPRLQAAHQMHAQGIHSSCRLEYADEGGHRPRAAPTNPLGAAT